MSRPVDEKLVSLKLDNVNFEDNARKSLSTFARINETFKKVTGLDFSKSSKSLADLDKSARGINLGSLRDVLETISWRFSNLGIIATSVLQNIANRVTNLAIQMGKGLTVAPLMDGLREYETKINAIQTIMSNTQGKNTMEDITNTLDELNTYADKTIYNFGEMVRNIGTFTAAGVSLQDSTDAIQGIANLAAASGSSSQQASTAMYQLSQALAAGRVNLMDWNSVVNAGMGGKLFQNALMDTAEAMGINVNRAENFRMTLQDGWLTTDVLLKTLQDFSKDDSMLDAATKVKTYSQLIDTTKEALGSGWAKTFEYIVGDFEQARQRFTVISELLNSNIDAAADKRNAFFAEMDKQGLGDFAFGALENGLKTIFKIRKMIGDVWSSIFPPLSAKGIVLFVREIELRLRGLAEAGDNVKWVQNLKTIFEGLFSLMHIGWVVLKEVAGGFASLIPSGLGGGLLELLAYFAKFPIEWNKMIKDGVGIRDIIVDIGEKGKAAVKGLFERFADLYGGFKKGAEGASIFKSALAPVWDITKKVLGVIVDLVKGVDLQDVVKAVNVGVVGGLLLMVRKFNFVLGDLTDSLTGLTTSVKAKSLVAISLAMLGLVVAMKMLDDMDGPTIVKTLTTLGAALGGMIFGLNALSKISMGGFNAAKTTAMLIAVSLALVIMAGALKVVSTMDPDEMSKSLGTLTAMLGGLVLSVVAMSKFGGKIGVGALALVGLATATLIMSKSLESLGEIDEKALTRSLIAMGVLLAEIAAFMVVVKRGNFGPGSAIGIAILSGALLIMVEGIKQLGGIDIPVLVQGLAAIGVILLEIGLFSRKVSGGNMLVAAAAMVVLSGALILITGPIKTLGEMDFMSLVKGLGALAIVLAEVVFAAMLAGGSMAGALSITAMAVAVNMLVGPLQALGSMSLAEIGTALLAVGGALAVLGAAAFVLGGVGAGPLLIFSTGLLAIGAAALLAGAGVTLFAGGLTALATLTAISIASIIQSFKLLLEGLIEVVPLLVAFAVTLVVGLARGIEEAAPELFDAGVGLIIGLLLVLSENIGPISEVATDLIVNFAEALGKEVPRLVKAGMQLIIDFINGLASSVREKAPDFIQAVMSMMEAILEVILAVLESVIIALVGWIPGAEAKVGEMGDKARGALRDHFKIDEDVKDKTDAALREVDKKGVKATTTGKSFAERLREGYGLVKMGPSGSNTAMSIIDGFASKNTNAKGAATSLVNNMKTGVQGVTLWDDGSNLALSFVNGLNYQTGNVYNQAYALAGVAKKAARDNLAIHSPSKEGIAIGSNFGESFGAGIRSQRDTVWDQAKNLAKKAIEATKQYAATFADSLYDHMVLDPVIKPVLDLSDVPNNPFDDPRRGVYPLTGVNDELAMSEGRLMGARSQQTAQTIQNGYTVTINNRGLLDGAQLVVREEADIERIADALDRRTAENFGKNGIRVLVPSTVR